MAYRSKIIYELYSAVEKEKQGLDLADHDFQALGVYRNVNDETRLIAADLAAIRLKKLWLKHGRIFLNPNELSDLWPGSERGGSA